MTNFPSIILTIGIIITCTITSTHSLFSSEATVNSKTNLKIISYNVFYGFNHNKSKEAGAAWIKDQKVDVIALQELNGIGAKELKTIAHKSGFEHAVILKEDGFPVGICSTSPIEVIEKRKTDMWHGYLHCKTQGVHFFVVHLSPFSYTFRQTEAKIITEKTSALALKGEQVVVLGDFNALSRDDATIYDKNTGFLKHCLKQEQKQSRIRNLNNGKFDYTAIETFTSAGLVDPYSLSLANSKHPRHTYPSKISATPEAKRLQITRRIDYILISKNMAKNAMQITTAHDAILETISDHYPVILTVKR